MDLVRLPRLLNVCLIARPTRTLQETKGIIITVYVYIYIYTSILTSNKKLLVTRESPMGRNAYTYPTPI